MAKRLLVMNGQKILQNKESGQWSNEQVKKANGLKAGIYNLSSTKSAETGQSYDGVIVHKDKEKAYQTTQKGMVSHLLSKMDNDQKDSIIEGANMNISYPEGKVTLTKSTSKEKTVRRSR
jgi:hypothetical protein